MSTWNTASLSVALSLLSLISTLTVRTTWTLSLSGLSSPSTALGTVGPRAPPSTVTRTWQWVMIPCRHDPRECRLSGMDNYQTQLRISTKFTCKSRWNWLESDRDETGMVWVMSSWPFPIIYIPWLYVDILSVVCRSCLPREMDGISAEHRLVCWNEEWFGLDNMLTLWQNYLLFLSSAPYLWCVVRFELDFSQSLSPVKPKLIFY